MKRLILRLEVILVLQIAFISGVAAQDVTPATALQHYLQNGDTTYYWHLKDSFSMGETKGYDLLLVSQHWKQYTWKHQLTIFTPAANDHDQALLVIAGGHNKKGTEKPSWKKYDDIFGKLASKIATKNHAIVAVVRQVPNEPLFGGKKEDEIISYTLHQFLKDSDYTWPLLFPMVKSAVHAMDAVQDFAKNHLNHPVRKFVVTGASKRGWTTWLTGASDPRVEGIAPMVIDILNMPVNLRHQLDAYGSYSKQINDYVKLGIVQGMDKPGGSALVQMVDPYSYRNKLTMPKLILMGTNDPYWVIDNVKNYLSGIPGTNLLNYTPNAGHGLNDGTVAFPALSAFFGMTIDHEKYPRCSWKVSVRKGNVHLKVKTSKQRLLGAKVWRAVSDNEDFRDEKWTSRNLDIRHKPQVNATISFPATGYSAFFVQLTYSDPNGGEYTICTRAFMTDTQKIL